MDSKLTRASDKQFGVNGTPTVTLANRDGEAEDQFLNSDDQLLKLKEENYNLRTSLKDLQIKLSLASRAKDQEILDLQARLEKCQLEVINTKSFANKCEEKSEYLSKKLDLFESALKSQIKNQSQSKDDLLEEIDQIEDPFALVIINKLLLNRGVWNSAVSERKTKSSFKSSPETELLREKQFEQLQHKSMRLQQEFRDISNENSTLRTQNHFLLKQLEFAEKQLISKGLKPTYGNSADRDYMDTEYQICQIFGIEDESRLIESLKKIEKAYHYVPVMQEALEQVFAVVTQNSFMPVKCSSTSQLVEILENWVDNLSDYQNLVTQLFDVLNIQEENLKNRTHLITSIKELALSNTRRDHLLSVNSRPEKENLNTDQVDLLEEFKRLKKMNNTTEFFCEEARRKLRLHSSYSNEALFTKILKVLENPDLVRDLPKTETSFTN
jgi:hypothetical protein